MQRTNYDDLFDDVKKLEGKGIDLVLFNIGSKNNHAIDNHQENPPFLAKLNKETKTAIFNIDIAYRHDPNQKQYNVDLSALNLIQLISYTIKVHKAKVIVFDNTCSSGLAITHIAANRLKDYLEQQLEVIIGYGTHGDLAIIPILQLSKAFVEQHNNQARSVVGQFAQNYCNECQTLHRSHETPAQNFADEHGIELPAGNAFLVGNPDVQAKLRQMASDQQLNIFFNLDEFAKIVLFSKQPDIVQKHNNETQDSTRRFKF